MNDHSEDYNGDDGDDDGDNGGCDSTLVKHICVSIGTFFSVSQSALSGWELVFQRKVK